MRLPLEGCDTEVVHRGFLLMAPTERLLGEVDPGRVCGETRNSVPQSCRWGASLSTSSSPSKVPSSPWA